MGVLEKPFSRTDFSKDSIENNMKSMEVTFKSFCCPICSSANYSNEIDLSIHVEECLSKKAIASLLKSEKVSSNVLPNINAGTQKKKSDGSSSNKIKKSRSSNSGRIDSFFSSNVKT